MRSIRSTGFDVAFAKGNVASACRLAGSIRCLLILVVVGAATSIASGQVNAPSGDAASGAADSSLSPVSTTAEGSPSLLDMYWASGTIGLLITLLSVVAAGFTVEHCITIRRGRLVPEESLDTVSTLIGQGRMDEAMQYCLEPENDSLVTSVVLAGLERYRSSEFGFAEYKSAMEEAGENCTNRLYRKIEVLNVVAVIAPMLGLLGTVQGMILAFNTIAAKGGMARPDELAGAISLALVTTFEGLVVAIPAMIASSFFRNRIDSLVAEAGSRVEHATMPLGRRRG